MKSGMPMTHDAFDREVRRDLQTKGIETIDAPTQRILNSYFYAGFTIRETVKAIVRSVEAEKAKSSDVQN